MWVDNTFDHCLSQYHTLADICENMVCNSKFVVDFNPQSFHAVYCRQMAAKLGYDGRMHPITGSKKRDPADIRDSYHT